MRSARVSLALLVLTHGSAVGAQEFRSAELCPLSDMDVGDVETFALTQPRGQSETFTVRVTCTVEEPCIPVGVPDPDDSGSIVNGTPTIVSEEDGGPFPGREVYRTEDASGLRLHRVFIPALQAFVWADLRLSG